MTIREVERLITGVESSDERVISSIEYNSANCKANSIFFCFPGLHTSGTLYIPDAVKNGAIAVVTTEEIKEKIAKVKYIIVQGNIRHLYAIASSAFFSDPWKKLVMIGVTGTDGKSSTSDFIYQLLKMQGIKCALLSTIYMDDGSGKAYSPYRQSTPEAFIVEEFLFRSLKNGCTHVVLECTSHALSLEYDRLAPIHFDASAFTKISSEHLEFHKTVTNYILSKLRLALLTKDKNAFIYSDNKANEYMDEETRGHFTFLEKIKPFSTSEEKSEYSYNNKVYSFPFSEEYMLENGFEAASLVSKLTSKDIDEVLKDAEKLKHIKGRSERINNTIGRNIIIDFAHTPDSFHSLFSSYRKLYPNGDFIALFGAAGNRDKSKRAGLGREAARFAKYIIITEEDPREEKEEDIANDIILGIPDSLKSRCNILVINDRSEAIEKAIELSQSGDTIFFLGKGHETSIEKNGNKIPYSEYNTVEDVLRRCSCSCRK